MSDHEVLRSDPETIYTLLSGLVGKTAWRPLLGIGSFVSIDFGATRRNSVGDSIGEFQLFLYGADWSLSEGTVELANSESSRETMLSALDKLEGLQVLGTTADATKPNVSLSFEHGFHLQVWHIEEEPSDPLDVADWMLFLPDGSVVVPTAEGKLGREPETTP